MDAQHLSGGIGHAWSPDPAGVEQLSAGADFIGELSIYLRKFRGPGAAGLRATHHFPRRPDQDASPNPVLVFALAQGKGGEGVDAYSDENQRIDRIIAELHSVTILQLSPLTPTSEEKTVPVLYRRLFERINRIRASEVVQACQDLWNLCSEVLSAIGQSFEIQPGGPELGDYLRDGDEVLDHFIEIESLDLEFTLSHCNGMCPGPCSVAHSWQGGRRIQEAALARIGWKWDSPNARRGPLAQDLVGIPRRAYQPDYQDWKRAFAPPNCCLLAAGPSP